MDSGTQHVPTRPQPSAGPDPAAPSAQSPFARVSVVGGRWPRRRLLVAAALGVLMVAVVQVLVGWEPLSAPMWSWLTLGAVALASLTAATFVPLPGQGARLDLGCSPCAVGGGLLALGGMWLAASSAYDGGSASLGLALAGAALARRVTEPQVCPT